MSFDLRDFYLNSNNSFVRGAVQIITPEHLVSCYANKCHELAVENVFKLLYKDFRGFKAQVWQEECCNRGNVLFQFCSNGFSLVWFPKRITDYQLKRVKFNYALIEEVNSTINSSISMDTNLVGENGDMLTLKEAMPKIKKMTFSTKK